jgi:predicted small integral membrane protein
MRYSLKTSDEMILAVFHYISVTVYNNMTVFHTNSIFFAVFVCPAVDHEIIWTRRDLFESMAHHKILSLENPDCELQHTTVQIFKN